MTNTKNLILAFPPFSAATSPPLGVCLLKSYIERTVDNWRVRTIDLNLHTHQKIEEICLNRTFFDPDNCPEGHLADIALARAFETFQGRHNHEFFHCPDRYGVYADMFLRAFHKEASDIKNFQIAFDKGVLPSLIGDHAEIILKEKPDAVGISICYTQQIWPGMCLARAIKNIIDVPIIMGGAFFSTETDVEEFLRQNQDYIDYIISGEGELSLATLLPHLNSIDLEIPGLTYIKNQSIHSNSHSFVKDIDCLGHPDFTDFDLNNYYSPIPVLPVLTSRGCYWRRCAFCVHYKSAGLAYRKHSIDHILDELIAHVKNGITNFTFIDEMISPEHFSKLADAIISGGLNINYYALAKPVKQFTPDLLKRISASGCKFIIWGVESGNQRILDLIDKGTHVSDIADVLRNTFAAGIFNHVYIITGLPTETRHEFVDTLRFLDANKSVIYAVYRGPFTLKKYSPIFDNPEKFSITRIFEENRPFQLKKYRFECSSGMSQEQAFKIFGHCLPFFRAFNPFSMRLNNFRDHSLLIFSEESNCLRPETREFPQLRLGG